MSAALILTAMLVSALACLCIVCASRHHAHLSGDHDLSGPQKFHSQPVPRIGGVAILAGLVAALPLLSTTGQRLPLLLLACAAPAFLAGFAEDLTKRVSPLRRLLFTMLSAGLAAWLLDALITRSDLPGVDTLLRWPVAAGVLTVVAVAGATNAVNIIDGFNGLASMCAVMMLLAIAAVAWQVGDRELLAAAVWIAAAVLGFFFWNFPGGRIFLGDGGAYCLGFLIAELAILLSRRHPDVSPLFALLVLIYPVFETVFSIYRKRFLRGMSPGVPDGVHLHMLVYKRLVRWRVGSDDARARCERNALTSPYLWLLCLSSLVPAILFWRSTPILLVCIVVFGFVYVALYWRIVRFQAPRWLVWRRPR